MSEYNIFFKFFEDTSMKEKEVKREVAARLAAHTSQSILELVRESTNSLELVRATDNFANRTGSLLRSIADRTTSKFRDVVKDATIELKDELKDLMRKASSDLTVSLRKIAKATAVGSTLLLMGTANLFSQTTYHIVGSPTGFYTNERTWDWFVQAVSSNQTVAPNGLPNTYILTQDIGEPGNQSTWVERDPQGNPTPYVTKPIGGFFRGTFDGNNKTVLSESGLERLKRLPRLNLANLSSEKNFNKNLVDSEKNVNFVF